MDIAVFVKTYGLVPCNMDEVLHYCGMKKSADNDEIEKVKSIANGLQEELTPKLSPKSCHALFPVRICHNTVDFGFASVESSDLAGHLSDCTSAVIFAATVGVEFDRMLARKSAVNKLEALVLQAIGAERIECLCDTFEKSIRTEYGRITTRFSPGYGDLSLEFQRNITNVLGCPKHIGVMLGKSLIMSPSKSVTAIIGVKG